jgi:hypothetical protein
VDRLAVPDCIVDLVGSVRDGQRRKLAFTGSNGSGRFCGGLFSDGFGNQAAKGGASGRQEQKPMLNRGGPCRTRRDYGFAQFIPSDSLR